jgi:hypothetical protein
MQLPMEIWKMKKLMVLLFAAFLLAGCGPSNEECDNAKEQSTALNASEATNYDEYIDSFERPLTASEITLLLNSEFPPDSVGYTLKECINGGRWEGYRTGVKK